MEFVDSWALEHNSISQSDYTRRRVAWAPLCCLVHPQRACSNARVRAACSRSASLTLSNVILRNGFVGPVADQDYQWRSEGGGSIQTRGEAKLVVKNITVTFHTDCDDPLLK